MFAESSCGKLVFLHGFIKSALVMALLPIVACKTWYKPGADEYELATERDNCEKATGAVSGKVFVECMARTGWRPVGIRISVEGPGDRV